MRNQKIASCILKTLLIYLLCFINITILTLIFIYFEKMDYSHLYFLEQNAKLLLYTKKGLYSILIPTVNYI